VGSSVCLTPLPESSFKPCRFLYATSTGSPAAGGFVAARVWVLSRVVVWPSCVSSPPCESGSWLACGSFIPWCHCAVTRECEAVLASPHCRRKKATAQAPAPARMHSPARIEQNGASEGGRHGRHVGQKLPSASAKRSGSADHLRSSNRPHACSNRLLQPATALQKGEGQSSQPPHWARHAGEFSTAKEAGLSLQNPCRHRVRWSWMPSDVYSSHSRATSSALLRRHAVCRFLGAAPFLSSCSPAGARTRTAGAGCSHACAKGPQRLARRSERAAMHAARCDAERAQFGLRAPPRASRRL
jgi:hypothetical protein